MFEKLCHNYMIHICDDKANQIQKYSVNLTKNHSSLKLTRILKQLTKSVDYDKTSNLMTKNHMLFDV